MDFILVDIASSTKNQWPPKLTSITKGTESLLDQAFWISHQLVETIRQEVRAEEGQILDGEKELLKHQLKGRHKIVLAKPLNFRNNQCNTLNGGKGIKRSKNQMNSDKSKFTNQIQ
jgi:hypothetical protein